MNNVETLPKLKNMIITIGSLPSSYVDSMSYYECLMWLCKYLNDSVIPAINTNAAALQELKDYVDEYLHGFEELKEHVDTLDILVNSINEQTEQNTEDIIALNNKINTDINNLRIELEEEINGAYDTLKQYVDDNVDDLNNKITNIQIGAISVYNPTNGLLQPLQIVLNDLYEVSNKDGLTATEFDALELTATAFDAYEITAYEFDSEGKIILV